MRAASLLHVVAVLAALLTTSINGAPNSDYAYLSDEPTIIQSPAIQPVAQKQPNREAYFNGAALLRLRSFVSVHRHSGLSFRTCEPGKLFEQRYDTGDSIGLLVDQEGLVFYAKLLQQPKRIEARLNARLLDNEWHSVNMFFRLGNLTLSAVGHAQVVANATYNSEILSLPEHNVNGTLIVGDGFRGCILQGPSILFNESINSNAVFGPCPETKACGPSGLTMTSTPANLLTPTPMIDWCQHSPCMPHGKCVNKPDKYECHCYARWSGFNCQTDNGSPCLRNPCINGGSCLEDSNGDYTCQCINGFVGQRCEAIAGTRFCDIANPCKYDSKCVELGEGDYRCDCKPGFTGQHCEINIDECASNPCKNHGNCTDAINGYVCKCDRTGYSGPNCELDIDECSNVNPCLNGYCHNNYGGYICECLEGFEGQNCEFNINECISGPCKNGGQCHDEVGSYRCNCTGTGFAGDFCDQPQGTVRSLGSGSSSVAGCETTGCPVNSVCLKDQCVCNPGYIGEPPNCIHNFCANNPCDNGGTCTNFRDRFECTCPPDWKGPTCKTVDAPHWCPNCANGGSCMDTPRGAICQCPRFWTGPHCKEPVSCRTHQPCKRATECRDYPMGYFCVCEPGWTGPECGYDIDECVSDPCRNGGVCIDQLDNYYCQCLTGYAGKNCQINVNECMSHPCQHGGVCIDHPNGYTCNCTKEYMGENCEREYDACASKPCQHNGTCVLTASKRDFVCECLPGFEGKICDLNVDDCVGVVCPGERICVDGVAEFECKCREGYREPNCTFIVDPCANKSCGNGTCVSVGDTGYKCECLPGYTGKFCDQDINECEVAGKSLCVNGICVNKPGSYECYCKPGYSGSHCDVDINECLCGPCKNNATCVDKINTFECRCPLGYSGKTCEEDINECEGDPCKNGGTCLDEIARYTCMCLPGFTGPDCETNIDDCEPQPCKNLGQCLDGINSYSCNCTDTGFEGEHCEYNIDDCETNPCENNATCIDKVKDYMCECWEGYTGKNCEEDIDECASSPCQYNGTCYERSVQGLYTDRVNKTQLPAALQNATFSYATASGYECACPEGTKGKDCEININECESNPCFEGTCIDHLGNYSCDCNPGFQGDDCREEIDECKLYNNPCKNGTCSDRKADYFCFCDPFFGGKNCTVPLTGCQDNACKNNGTCVPYLFNETEHRFNCTCQNGFHGEICDHITTMSFNKISLVTVNTSRDEGYDIQFQFKTTLPDGLLAVGYAVTYYMLELIGGRLNLQSSILNKWNGVFIGSGLNDSKWHKVFVAINTTHLVLSADDEQTIYPINLNEGGNTSSTSFTTTYIGGTVSNLRKLPGLHWPPYFIGCTQDVIVNGEWVYSGANLTHVEMQNVEAGCPREEQCLPNPCKNNGFCTDRWSDFSCKCERPYLGDTCQYNMTAVTFGYENITNGYVTVKVNDTARRALRSIVDISMFIRSREEYGDIFYLGSEPSPVNQSDTKERTFISAHLERGELLVRIHFNGTEAYTVGGVKLNDGNNHMIQVIRNITLVQVKINGTEYFRKTISTSGQLNVTVLYLGGQPQMLRFTRQVENVPLTQKNFKGIIQDVQISNGSETMVVEFYPLNAKDIPKLVPLGKVTFDHNKVLEGVISDNVCANNPCSHNGTCHVTWNDFWCQCPRGYTGKTCQEMEFCQLQDCPTGSTCQNLDDGYECMANATFDGVGTAFTYVYRHQGLYNSVNQSTITEAETETNSTINTIKIVYRSNTGGTLLYIAPKAGIIYFTVSVFEDKVTVAWKLNLNYNGILTFGKPKPDGNWTSLIIKLNNDSIECYHEDSGDDIVPQTSQNFNFKAWYDLLLTGSVTLGGLSGSVSNRNSYLTFGTERHIENRDGIIGNSVDFIDQKLTTSAPPHSMLSGEAFKGCLGEVRIGNMLLHYFTYEEIYQNAKFTPLEYMALQQENSSNHENIGCRLCFENNCQNGGHCLDQYSSYVCDCPAGYAEEDCSVNIDECEDNKCANNSTCVDGVANYTCVCQQGWQGWLCEKDVDECVSKPCLHDGVCINLPGSFHCECSEDYIGDYCQTFKQITCADGRCKNGSSCEDVVNPRTGDNFTCTCMPGYEGKFCDTPYCFNKKCENGGECKFDNQPPHCYCPLGFTGDFCETNINDCAPDSEGNVPCANDGQCHDGINSYTCDCSETGYTGPNCADDIDECQDPHIDCSNNGACRNELGFYRCDCNKGYCGLTCNMVDPCEGHDYCQNGGTCVCENTGYTCLCPPKFQGKNCTEEKEYGKEWSPMDVAVIVGPILGVLFLIAAGSLIAFFMMARKKRATRGTYSPSAQEFSNPRVEMDNVMKPPPEERLI